MAIVVYALCAAISSFCTFMLLRGYYRRKSSLLIWSGLCFAGLTLNSVMVIIDKTLFPDVSMLTLRLLIYFLSLLLLIFGFIFRSK